MSSRLGSMVVSIALNGLDSYKAELNSAANATNQVTEAMVTGVKALAASYVTLKLMDYAKDAALLNARYETLGVSMQVVGKNAGYTGSQMEAAAQGMQKMGISMAESRQQAMRMVQAHIDLADSQKLARIAQDAAVIGNMNSSEAFAQMIHGIQSGQTDVLRTIGLNVSMEQSYKAIAATLHKNVDALTQNEKTQGVLNAVMTAGEGIAGTYAASMDTAGKQLQSMKRYTEDLQLKVGEVFNEALTVGVMAFTDNLKDANTEMSGLSRNGDLQRWGEDVTNLFVLIGDNANNLIGALKVMGYTAAALAAASNLEIWDSAGRAAIKEQYDADVAAVYAGEDRFSKALDARRQSRKEQAEKDARVAETIAGDRLGRFDLHKYADTPAAPKAPSGISEATKGLQLYNDLMATSSGLSAGFAKDWAQLNAAFAARTITVDELTAAQAKLLEKQEFAKDADRALAEQNKISAEAVKQAADARQRYTQELDQTLAKQQEETARLQESIDRMGLSKTAVAELDAAKLEAMATTQDLIVLKKIEQGADESQYETYVKLAEELRKQAALKRELAGKETQLANIEAERSYWASIEQAAHQTFTSVTQGAQDMGSKVRDAIKAGVFDWLWQITARKWFIDIQANVSGGAGSAAMQAASGGAGGGATSWLSSLFSPGGGVSNLISNVGASLINGPFSSMLGDFGATMISNSSMIAGALPYFGVAIAGLSALRSAMQYTVTPNGGAIVANVGAGGASSVANRTDFIQQGGLFGGGTTHNSSWADADADTTAYIDQAVQAITAGNRAYATALGLNNDALDAYTAQLTINTSGMDAAAAKAAIDGALTQFASDQASAAYGDAIKAFAKDGEKATDTLARLATNLTTANQWAEFFGTTMYDVSVTGAAAASTLIEAFGGLEAMNASLSSYYQNYYTPEEQKQKTIENVQKNLHDNGIDLSIDQLKGATKEGIRAYVEAARLMMLAGQITEAQFAAIVNNANTMAPIATSETPPSTEPGTPGGDALAPFDASAPGETVAQREARYKASASDPFWGLFRGTQSYGGAEGRTGGGDGTTRPMGSGPNGSGPAAGSDANGFQDTIKSWLEKLATTDAGGLDPMRQRDNAYGAFAAQLSLARAGDAKALGSITGYADTYLAAVKDTARTAFEEQMAISKTRAAVGGLLTPEDKVVSAVSQVNRTLVNGFAALTGTAGGVGTGGGLGAAQGGTQGSATVAKALQGIQSDMRVAQVQLLPMVNSLTLLVERWEKKGMPAQRSNA